MGSVLYPLPPVCIFLPSTRPAAQKWRKRAKWLPAGRGGGRDGMKKYRDEAGELRLTSGGLERRHIIKAAYTSYKFELAGLWTEN